VTRAVATGVLLTFLTPALCVAQAPASTPAPAAQTKPGQAAPPATAAIPLETPGFTYNSDGRRDPFVSLLRRGSELQRGGAARLAGLGGLGVGEVTLKGTFADRDGYVAILQGSDDKNYIVRPGEKLLDGTIRSITANAIVMLQQVNDPLSLEKQREVRKVLRQTEEAK
jgi:Tfp pilus assembly protein PilP